MRSRKYYERIRKVQSPSYCRALKMLFNIMVHHGFVPDSFGNGVIIPLVKDKQGDFCTIGNYHGITLSPFFAKLF